MTTEQQDGDRPVDPEAAVKLRGDPPRVMRLSRKAIGVASACGFAVIGGALIYALQPQTRKRSDELYNTQGVTVADNLAGAPKDYGQVPKLGPPLPGDLGKPILDAQRRGDVAALPPVGAPAQFSRTLPSEPPRLLSSARSRNAKLRVAVGCSSVAARPRQAVLVSPDCSNLLTARRLRLPPRRSPKLDANRRSSSARAIVVPSRQND